MTTATAAAVNVPLLDLKAQYATIRSEIEPVVKEVIESQYFIGGPKIAELEAEKKSKQAEIKMLQQAKDSESGGEMKELEEEAAEISKGLVKATSAWQHSKENLGTDSQKSQYTHTQNIHTQSTLAYVHIYMSGLYEE